MVAQAQSIEVSGDRVVFTFLPTHRTLREQFEQTRPWIEAAAERMAGRKVRWCRSRPRPAPRAAGAGATPSRRRAGPSANGKRI